MISRAVIPAAGMGARLCPLTPFLPKEMLPICGFPAIHHSLFELAEAGIEEVMIVVSAGKDALVSYLTEEVRPKGAEATLLAAKRRELLGRLHIRFSEQKELTGTADAIYLAREFMQGEPIFVLYPDDLLTVSGRFAGGVRAARDMIRMAEESGDSVLLAAKIPASEAKKYGVITLEEERNGRARVRGIVEKPKEYVGTCAFALVGRMILTNEAVNRIPRFDRNDAAGIVPLLNEEGRAGRLRALLFSEARFDVGSHEGYAEILRALSEPSGNSLY